MSFTRRFRVSFVKVHWLHLIRTAKPGPLHGRGHRKRLLTTPRQGKACNFLQHFSQPPAVRFTTNTWFPPQKGSSAVSVKDFSEVHQINHPNLTQQPWQAHLAGHPLCFNQHFHLSFHGWCFSTRQLNQTRRSNHETAPLPRPSCQTFETVIIECYIDIIYNSPI